VIVEDEREEIREPTSPIENEENYPEMGNYDSLIHQIQMKDNEPDQQVVT
jgi:hypothetical protein